MNLSKQPISARAIDIGYLSTLVTLTAAGVFASGIAANDFGFEMGAPILVKLFYFSLLESLLLLWAMSKVSGRRAPYIASIFTIRMQAQAAMQVCFYIYTAEIVGLGVAYVLNWINTRQSLYSFISLQSITDLNRFFLIACPLMTIWITTWRLNMLNNRGHKFGDVNSGKLNRAELVIVAPLDVATKRLEHYLNELKLTRTPELPFFNYGKRPAISHRIINGSTGYELTWRFCPSKIRIVLETNGEAVTTVVMTCQLRSGYHRHELFTNADDASGLMTYLQTNVLQLFGSELALSASTTRQDKLRTHALEMQLRILQAQIEPHFLFNTLASVRHLYRSSTDAGELMMDHVITYLRCTMQELRSDVSTVGKEMDLVLHYLAIMKIRMGERLSYSFIHFDDVAHRAFPPAMLISLVENAIKHGLNERADGKLTISAAREKQHLRVTVLDNGPGFSSVQGTGVGLSNIRQRLEAIYGNRAWLEVGALANGGFVASIVVPFPNGDSAETEVLA